MIKKIFTTGALMSIVLLSYAQTYNVTFKVNMNKYSGTFTKVYVTGTFNSWCGDCNELTDGNSDGIFEGTFSLSTDNTEFKYEVDNWNDQENFSGGESCTVTNGGFTNRFIKYTADTTLGVACWASCDDCSNKKQQDLPISWDATDVDYTVVDFGGNVSSVVADPTNSGNMVLKSEKPQGSQTWAGTTLSDKSGLATVIPFDASHNTISVDVYSPDAGIPVRLKAEVVGTPTQSVETEVSTTKSGAWETLVFDFSKQATGTAAIDYSYKYNMLSIFYNFGTDGNTAGDKTYYCDNIKFGGSGSSSGTANITFKVDMNKYTGTYTQVNLNGTFNNWCGSCAVMTDDNSDGVYELTVDLTGQTEVEYKFTVDGWTDDEKFAGGESCTKTTGGFTNRVLTITGDSVLPVVCWQSCSDCGNGPSSAKVTFMVDMSQYKGTFTQVNLNGTFNNWCGDCAVMTDDNSDMVYELMVSVNAKDTIEYKFTVDGWTDQENFSGGEPCTKTTGEFTNRMLVAKNDTSLDAVCWGLCTECPNGIGEVTHKLLSVSPNPSNGIFNVLFSEPQTGSLVVYNYQGKEVYRNNQLATTRETLNLSNQPKGVYLVRITNQTTTETVQIVVE
ncbi:T9SS type A sorting domain-containing protein [bacterium]|nr:T9SS type A sorting domain-containing protein [bacterium]